MAFNKTLTDWLTTFWKILISPTPNTFTKESEKANGKFPSAVGWLIFFVIYIFIFYIIATKQVLITGLIVVLLALPLSVVLCTSAMHFIYQRIFKRKQYLYEKFIYIYKCRDLITRPNNICTDMGYPFQNAMDDYQRNIKLCRSFISNRPAHHSSEGNYQPQILAGSCNNTSFSGSCWSCFSMYSPLPIQHDGWGQQHSSIAILRLSVYKITE